MPTNDDEGNEPSVLGTATEAQLPKVKGLRLVSDGGLLIEQWVRRQRFQGKVQSGSLGDNGGNDAA